MKDKMSDFDLLKYLQNELIEVLNARKQVAKWIPNSCCKAKVHRLRLEIQEVMYLYHISLLGGC